MEYMVYPIVVITLISAFCLLYYKGQYDVNTQLATVAKNNSTYTVETPTAEYTLQGNKIKDKVITVTSGNGIVPISVISIGGGSVSGKSEVFNIEDYYLSSSNGELVILDKRTGNRQVGDLGLFLGKTFKKD